jgi:GrpB-like predicted nucleotidyltransferase (UPF0157 family)
MSEGGRSADVARRVELAAHDPGWGGEFERVAEVLRPAFGPGARVHHIGSTSIEAVGVAKPVIDVLVEVGDLADAERAAGPLEAGGFEARGEYGIPGRRYFVRAAEGERPRVHVHAYRAGDPQVARHLAFRDYLRAHPHEARAYGELKRALAAAHPGDAARYQDGKTEFIHAVDQRAAAWSASRGGG